MLEIIKTVNTAINGVVWGPIMLTLLIGTGLLLSARMGFPQFTKFIYVMKHTIGSMFSSKQRTADEAGVSPFQAVATAMAGTIGTGSITGVATALVSGGPGAIFWMWISALLGMVTKYSEILLSLHFREKNEDGQYVGGPMYYIQNGLGWKWLAMIFAFFVAIACLGTGNATQGNSISVALESVLGIPPVATGIVLTIIVGAVILGGIRRIAAVNEKLVPFMAVFYVIVAVIALVLNAKEIPGALALIISEAFNFQSAAGGVAGYGIMQAMRYGFARGVFSNEAGLGSAPIAHASSSAKNPVDQAMWGMFEVFFTTI
ncbi:MAG: sodium:alanine symporter family protein, partial [Peptococcaceae bacterium]|nr:sodium:alanine symporter family protein [Peptococcaceae bacterium]